MASPLVRLRREKIAPCLTCLLCNKLLREAITISLCLHSFCRKCIYEKLSGGNAKSCPLCDINLGRVWVDKLRPDHNLQDIRTNIFPLKKRKVQVLEVSPSAKIKESSLSSLVSRPVVPMQVAPTLPPTSATDKVTTKEKILAIECQQLSVTKKRRLEEILERPMKELDYHPCWNLRTEGSRLLLDMACCLVQSTVPAELSKELIEKPLAEILNCIMHYFANFFGNNSASVSHPFKEIDLYNQKLVDKEAFYMKQCSERKLSNLRSDHDANQKEQAYFYNTKLKEQALHYEAKLKSLENEVVEKRKEFFDQNKQLEQLHDAIKKKNISIEMLCELVEDAGIRLKETMTSLDESRRPISLLEEQVNMISKLQEESHRAGMEEGVKRVVRAVQAASPNVNWDRIHISENTPDEDREAFQRAFVEGIMTTPSLATQVEDQGHIIIL